MSSCAIRRCSRSCQAECSKPAGRAPRLPAGRPSTALSKPTCDSSQSRKRTSCSRRRVSLMAPDYVSFRLRSVRTPVYTKAFLFNRRSAMHRSVPLHLCALAFIALLGFPDTAPARQVSDSDTRIMSVAGVKETEQHRTIFQIRIAVRSGEDPDAARREALATFEANDAGPADFAAAGYSLTGPVWGQFFTHPRSDDVLVQRYNPAHAPAGLDVVQALLNAQATWTDVRSSRFRFEYGGQTTEPIVEGDGISDVGWLDPEPPPPPPPPRPRLGFLAVTLMTFDRITGRFIDADVFINPGVMWTTDGTGLDLEEVILHEEGHVAGLDHVLDSTSVMYPASRPDDLLRTLNDGDIDGITILYPRTPAKRSEERRVG